MRPIATAACSVLALGYAVFVGITTLLPTGTDLWFVVFDVARLATPHRVGRLVVVSALVGGLALVALAWRRRHLWMARLSLPLVAYALVCVVGLGTLVLMGQPPRYLARLGLRELGHIADDFDVRHMISYFGFAVVVATAWRARVSLPLLGVALMAYGFCLELAQEWVPSRNFRLKDLASNGLGILLGMCWVYLYDSLFGAQGTALSRLARRRRRRALARRSDIRPTMQPRRS